MARELLILAVLVALLSPGARAQEGSPEGPRYADAMQGLTGERRERAEQQLRRWRHLSPEQKAQAMEQRRHFEGLPAASRDRVKRNFHRWQNLTPERRDQIHQLYRSFRELPREERQRLREKHRGHRVPRKHR